MKLSSGKTKGLRAVSDNSGIIAAAAMDQRKTLRKMIAEEKGVAPEVIKAEVLKEFKEAVAKTLSPHASALLLDPELGISAARLRASNCGLIYAYENSEYDKSGPGRLPSLLPGFSAQRLVELGADCVKILLYYSPVEPVQINDTKRSWVERVGAECQEVDVPFFLELISYQDGISEKSIDFARKKPDMVLRSVEEFSRPRYAVDIMKLEAPINMAFVKETRGCVGESAYNRDEAKRYFRRLNEVAGRPFIFLSAGVSNDTFNETLDLAVESNSLFCGVLCGRAVWQGGVPVYVRSGRCALEEWLEEVGVTNLRSLHDRLKSAKPWFSFYEVENSAELSR
jgi:tagatose 1,6-diphosphate aldolase